MYAHTPCVQATQKAAPQHAAIWGDSTLRTLLSIFLPQLRLEGQTMKLQANAGTPKVASLVHCCHSAALCTLS